MGTVVGMMGVAQAGEAIKILASNLHKPSTSTTSSSSPSENLYQPHLLLYTYDLASGVGPYTFRAVKMGGRKKNCFACGENSPSTLTLEGIQSGNPNYERFCGLHTPKTALLPKEERITASAYHQAKVNGELPEHILIDTREKEHFSFGSIEGAINVPFATLLTKAFKIKRAGLEEGKGEDILPPEAKKIGENAPIFLVCRRGLDSQEAVEKLKELGVDKGGKRKIMDIMGGMKAWKDEVDPEFQFI